MGLWTKRWGNGMLASAIGALLFCVPALADGITYGHDDGRTGWYPDQSGLPPQLVAGGSFGQQFSTPVDGQVYAQPLVADGKVLVATETNHVYGLDADTGVPAWTRALGTPFNPTAGPRVNCGDLTPSIGITGTPVVDTATATAYLAAKKVLTGGQVVYDLHALNMSDGSERTGFPVRLQGAADNAPSLTFDAEIELQRPGLLLEGGSVYAAFGGHCDQGPWKGWIMGVRAFGQSAAGSIATRWVTPATTSADGGGIWQAGSGLMSDGPGRVFAVTGNTFGAGGLPSAPTPASSPPAGLGESAVRLDRAADGRLAASSFFTPHDAQDLDNWDADFASGGPVALPDAFGDTAHPHVMAIAGKKGIVYLLDRDTLGGYKQGALGGDGVVDASTQRGGVWSKPTVWPGEGGYVYLPTASGGTSGYGTTGKLDVYKHATVSGHTALVYTGSAPGDFGFGSSAPVVTSDATQAGSAVVWIVRSPDGSGAGAELRAYGATLDPTTGELPLLRSWPIGTAAKFTPPGVGARKVYLGTRDGRVLGFGAPASPPLTTQSATFPTTTVGDTSTGDVVFTATRTVSISDLSLGGSAAFTKGTPVPALPATLRSGEILRVPVSFSPTSAGTKGATLTATTTTTGDGVIAASVSATAQTAGPMLAASARLLDFGGVALGSEARLGVTFTNTGGSPLQVEGLDLPRTPFAVEGIDPAATIQPGASVDAIVHFAPKTAGDYAEQLRVRSNSGVAPGWTASAMGVVGLTGAGSAPPQLLTEPATLDFGAVAPGTSALRSLTVRNAGGSVLTVYKSKPPSGGAFTAVDSLDEGTTLQAGEQRTLRIRFAPDAPGTFAQSWPITANDATGARTLSFAGSSSALAAPVAPAPPAAAPAAVPAPTQRSSQTTAGSVRLSAWRFRTATRMRVRVPGAETVRITLELRRDGHWSRRPGHRNVRLIDGVRTVVLSAKGLRAGRWRVVVRPLPHGTARRGEFTVVR